MSSFLTLRFSVTRQVSTRNFVASAIAAAACLTSVAAIPAGLKWPYVRLQTIRGSVYCKTSYDNCRGLYNELGNAKPYSKSEQPTDFDIYYIRNLNIQQWEDTFARYCTDNYQGSVTRD